MGSRLFEKSPDPLAFCIFHCRSELAIRNGLVIMNYDILYFHLVVLVDIWAPRTSFVTTWPWACERGGIKDPSDLVLDSPGRVLDLKGLILWQCDSCT